MMDIEIGLCYTLSHKKGTEEIKKTDYGENRWRKNTAAASQKKRQDIP